VRHGIGVHHPRYPVLPRVGMSLAPVLLYGAAASFLGRLMAGGTRIDAIDAHYLYPDGVAAVWLGRRFSLPVVVTARGTDVSLIPRYRIPRRLIRGAIAGAAALVAVSAALKAALVELGAPAEKVTVLRNGVETAVFIPPTDRAAARAALGLTRPTLISVGHLIERKGHHLAIEALRDLPEWELIVVGEGPERSRLGELIERLGLGERVRLLGARPHAALPALYGAADTLVLASSREGWANVLLESMACGTPVVATNVWGNPEVVQDRAAGVIVERSAAAIAAGVRRLAADAPDRGATRAYAERFGWDETTAGQLALFRRVVDGYSPVQTGGRLVRNASIPSRKSWLM
jgi:teichuronic acid biosynthesis glycosyltransferase TuaC